MSAIIIRRSLASLCLLVAVNASLSAQPGASIRGFVIDQSGASVPGAIVTVSAGRPVYTSVADAHGRFTLVDVALGEYTMQAEAPGLISNPLSLHVNATAVAPITLIVAVAGVREALVVGPQRIGALPGREALIPGSYEVVSRDVIDRTHPHDTNEVLRKISGISVRDEEGLGLRPNIGIRGLNPTRSSKVLLLEDGIPLTFAPYGDNASYYHPPIERFDTVEVLKGSGQIAFGPSTVGGVVNYITPVPPARFAGNAFVTAGNRAFRNVNATLGGTRGRIGLLADVMRKESDGSRENTHSDLTDVSGKIVATAGSAHVFTGKVNYYAENSQLTYSGLRSDEYATNPRQNAFRNDAFEGDRAGGSLAHAGAVSDELLLTTTAYVSSFARDWWRQSSNSAQRPNDSGDPDCAGMDNLNTTCGNEGRLRRYLSLGVETRARVDWPSLSLDGGVRVHREQQERRQENGATPLARAGVVVENNARDVNAYSAFVQPRFHGSRLAVTPGLRVEHVRFSRLNRLANSGQGAMGVTSVTQVIPGIAVSATLTADSILFAGIHRGFAPPRVEDIISNAGGLVDLDAELSWNTEAGIRGRIAALALSTAWFRMDYQNQIIPASVAGGVGATLSNAGRTLHQGVELAARLDSSHIWDAGPNVYARIAGAYLPLAKFTGTRTSSIRGFETVSVSGNRLPYAPRYTMSATLGLADERWFDASLEAVAIGEQFGDDLNTRLSSVDGQLGLIPSTVIWNAAANVIIRPSRVTAYVTTKNLANRLYIADRSRGILPGLPRLVHAGVRVGF